MKAVILETLTAVQTTGIDARNFGRIRSSLLRVIVGKWRCGCFDGYGSSKISTNDQ